MFSTPDQFNDPFDMINFLIDTSHSEHELEQWIEGMAGNKNLQQKEFIRTYLNDSRKVSSLIDQALDKLKQDSGVSCFSKSYNKTLMWSHYSEKHRGVCLGFKFFPTGRRDNLLIMSVKYIDKITTLNFFKDRHLIFFHWIFTKSHVWSYEQEVRAIVSNQNGLIPFRKECLREIHFGLNTTTEQRNQLVKLLFERNYKGVSISRMVIDPNTFDLANIE